MGIEPEEIEPVISLKRKAMIIETKDEVKEGDLLRMIENLGTQTKAEHWEIVTVISDVQLLQPRKSGVYYIASFHVVEVKSIAHS
jgi:hypothetical protein